VAEGTVAEGTVAAVVVTWNRLDLLREALPAVLGQTRPPDRVIVVDNASTDGTADEVRGRFPGVTLVSLARNTGGAGGFAYGLALAQAAGAALAWLMDDDTVPEPGALAALLDARAAYPGSAPALVASRVVWTDGRAHPMNTPRVKPLASAAERAAAAAAGCVPVRSASFVSVLADTAATRRAGLPQADYFLWNDDFEFTARLLRRSPGLLCPASVVVHKTKAFGATDADPGARFFYEVRNKVWTLRSGKPLAAHERVLYGGATLRRWARTFARSSDRGTLARCLLRGLVAGLKSGPRPTAEVLASAGVTMPPDPALLVPRDPGPRPAPPAAPPSATAS
jgi:GT2 family glycosyltransferase